MHFKRVIFLFLLFFPVFSSAYSLRITPKAVVQGNPALVSLETLTDSSPVSGLVWNGKRVPLFVYRGKLSGLIGIDLRDKTGTSTLVATLVDEGIVTKEFLILPRPKVTAPLGIPDKLGGNTPQAQRNLANTLVKENAKLAAIQITSAPFWTKSFIFPVKNPLVTDPYGYLRKTGYYDIAHKGVDFRADARTKVFAINDGVVRLSHEFTVYGKIVVIDHGTGVLSLYMHLSKLNVKEGQKVKRGETIGLSGESGYALSPHLHLSVRIGGVSIDPMKFFALFDVKM